MTQVERLRKPVSGTYHAPRLMLFCDVGIVITDCGVKDMEQDTGVFLGPIMWSKQDRLNTRGSGG